MPASFQKGCESIATRFAAKTGSSIKAKSLDWMGIITQIAAILVPLFTECKQNRGTSQEVAQSIKQRPFIARRRLRQGLAEHLKAESFSLRQRINLRHQSDELMDAIMEEAAASETDDLAQVIDEATEPV